MADFDLIPHEYRLRLAVSQWLRRLGTIIGGTVIVAFAGSAALAYANNSLESRIQQLQTQHAMTTQQQAQLETLDFQIAELHRQWQLLNALRSGAPVERIFTVVDVSLGDTPVWFQDWDFVREGAMKMQDPATVNTGYFIVVPQGENAEQIPAWQIDTHIKIRGQAHDHAALSTFVRSLFQRSEVLDVRVQETTLRRLASVNVVEFELAILLNSQDGYE